MSVVFTEPHIIVLAPIFLTIFYFLKHKKANSSYKVLANGQQSHRSMTHKITLSHKTRVD